MVTAEFLLCPGGGCTIRIDAELVVLRAGSQWLGNNEQQLWEVQGDGDMVEAGTP